MINFTVDENNVFGKFVEEAGKYNVRILPTSTYKQSMNGNDMATFDYEVLDGEYAGGKIRYDNNVWVDTDEDKLAQSVKRFNTLAVAVGVKNGQQMSMDMGTFVTKMIGSKLNITVDWEENNKGDFNLRVKSHNVFDTEGSKPNGVKKPALNSAKANNSFDQSNIQMPTGMDDPFAQSSVNFSDADVPF